MAGGVTSERASAHRCLVCCVVLGGSFVLACFEIAPAPRNASGSRHPGRYQRRPSAALHSPLLQNCTATPPLLAVTAPFSAPLHADCRCSHARCAGSSQTGAVWPVIAPGSQFPAAETLQGAVCVHGRAHGHDADDRLPALCLLARPRPA
jgi:hypothetical protein